MSHCECRLHRAAGSLVLRNRVPYSQVGMSKLRERPGNIFVGYGPETQGDHFVIELAQVSPKAPIFQ
eukprot:gene4854-5927_t